MANNPFQTPTGTPWALPPLSGGTTRWGTLFNTADRVTRLQARWNAASGVYQPLSVWNSGSQAQANTGFGHALKYLATNNNTEATNSYNAATTESFTQETDNARIWCDSLPYCYAWCRSGLTSAQQTTLISDIEANNTTRENALATLGKFLLDGPGNGNGTGMTGYVFGCIAIMNQPGATDRRTNLRNLCNNYANYLAETYGDGWWHSYDFIPGPALMMLVAYHIATGEESLLASRVPWIAARPEVMSRLMSSNNWQYFRGPSHNAFLNGSGQIFTSSPDNPWMTAVISEMLNRTSGNNNAVLLAKNLQTNFLATNTPARWTWYGTTSASVANDCDWLGLLFSDDTVTGKSPAQLGLALNNSYPTTGHVEFRGGWNQSTDLVSQFSYGQNAQNDHSNWRVGALTIRVGNTWLIKDNYAYGGRPSNWETAAPPSSTEVGGYTMSRSSISFQVAATEATRPDRGGSATIAVPTSSSTAYPLSNTLTNGVRQTWKGGSLTSYSDNGTVAQVVADYSPAFPQVTSVNTTYGYVRGASSDVGTFVIWDQFVAPGTVDIIRRNFCSFNKPTFLTGTETVLQGASAAGLLSATGSSVVITNGSYQVTIQCVSTMSGINAVGGTGFENFYDSYGTSGGANMDFLSNTQNPSDNRFSSELPWLTGQWRTSFYTTQATASEMIFVLTVQTTGSTAPVYTRTSALALLTQSSIAMPGLSQYWAQQLLNAAVNRVTCPTPTLYLAAFTTVPSDTNSGGVEPVGNGYARVQIIPSTGWNLASQGSPCTITNASPFTFPAATGGNWGSITGFGFFDSASGGNLLWADYLGTFSWVPFTCTSGSPGVITSPGHGYSNSDSVVVTAKYGGTLPPTSGSWSGTLTVENVTTNTFDVSVNTTGVGDGQVRKIVPQTVNSGQTLSIAAGQLTLSLA